jgi:hypothetical protein
VESHISETTELSPTQVKLNYAIKFEWFWRLYILLIHDIGSHPIRLHFQSNLLEFGDTFVKGKLQNVITPLDYAESKIWSEVQSCI